MSTSDPAAHDTERGVDTTKPIPDLEVHVDTELTPGTVVGEYVIESKLGQGGMATVYAGKQPVIGKRVAVKVMSRHLCLDPVQVERFVQEARAVNQIGHPNIVDVFAFGALPDGRSYFVMEWLQGETLAARLRRGWLPIPEAVAIMFQICDGLAAAHDKSIVHRDLKPENIFLVPVRNRRLLVKLLDFGIAKLGRHRDLRVDRTAEGMTPGTPSYMSPEQTRGKDVDHRTDIYSLGVTAFEMVCGRLPYLGSEAVDVLYQHMHAMPPAPSSLRPDILLQLERLIVQMLEKKPDRRPTIPVIEETLADLRDGPLHALGDTGPQGLRALEQESGKFRVVAPKVAVEPTDEFAIVRPKPPRALLAVAGALAAMAIAAAAWKLSARPAPSPITARAEAAPLAPPIPSTEMPTSATETQPPEAARPPKKIAAAKPSKAPVAVPPRRHTARHEESSTSPTTPNRDYMIDPFASKK